MGKHNINYTVAMEETLENYDLDFKFANRKIIRKKSNKCNHCDYSSSQAGDLMRHLKTHIGEKSNKCNQCDFVSSQASSLRRH